MKKLFLSFSFAAIGALLAITSHADPMAVVKGHAVFLTDTDSLTIVPDTPGGQLTCTYDVASDIFIPGTETRIEIPIAGAADVKVAGNHAYVATLQQPPGTATSTDFIKYDISACLPEAPFTSTVATADLAAGELVIPCVVVGSTEYNIIMNQRGNSMNWEIIFAESGCK
jgi:hypothetical protein